MRLLAPAVVALGLLAGCSDDTGITSSTTAPRPAPITSPSSTTSATAPGEVVKEVMGTVADPPGAPGRTLTLIRYTIPAGAQLAPHVHPGVQLASIRSGTLTYTVVEGTAIVRRRGASTDDEVRAPTTIRLGPGDTVTELDAMVHYGANETEQEVVIMATLLTIDGDDLAVPVTTTTVADGG